ncbi:MAG TPA: PepSY-associated TM helix domain-containing protein [Burkholderiaceae bacterium]|jgi:uncharacterized iron-regulated membrane protein|nr:PepSY-associated TM helix domain-containing protein [Burkholderiaceae bacterium]
MRRVWVAVHRYCGLALLVLLLVNAVTGSLIAFEHEIDAWLNPQLHRVADRPALAPDALIARVEQAHPHLQVSQIPLDAQPGQAYELRVVPRLDATTGKPYVLGFDRLFADPATGAVLGHRTWGALRVDRVHVMTFLNVLHRKFQLPGKWGMWLTGTAALVWLFTALVGTCLTLPRLKAWRAGFWQRWKPAWQIKRGAAWQRTTFDLHRALGLWTLPVALTLAVSGVYFSLGNEVFRPVVRWFAPLSVHPINHLQPRPGPTMPPAFGTEAAIERARAYLPPAAHAFQPWYASHVPRLGVYRIAFKEAGMREQRLRLRYEQVFIDDRSGALKGFSGYETGTSGDRFLIWQYPLHTGRILGWWGRLLVCMGGVATESLCVAGLMVWWSRRPSRRMQVARAMRTA